MKKTAKPTSTKAAAQNPADGTHTELAQVNSPEKLTDAKIAEISGDDGTDEPENSANKDVAKTLKEASEDAKDPEQGRAYFGGQGGAAGI